MPGPPVADRPPHPLGRARHVDVAHAEVAAARRPPRSAPRASSRSCPTRRCPWRRAGSAASASRCWPPRSDGSSAALGMRVVGERRRSAGCRRRRRRTPPTAPATMPWAMPPCCWPATSSGLRMRPQSSTATWRTGVDPAGLGVDLDDRRRARRTGTSRRPGAKSSSAASGAAVLARPRPASSAHVSAVAGTPATPRRAVVGQHDVVRRRPRAARGRERRGLLEHARRRAAAPRCRRAAATASRRCRRRAARARCRTARSGSARSGCRAGRDTIIANAVAWPWPCAEVPDRDRRGAVGVHLDRAVLARPIRPPVIST